MVEEWKSQSVHEVDCTSISGVMIFSRIKKILWIMKKNEKQAKTLLRSPCYVSSTARIEFFFMIRKIKFLILQIIPLNRGFSAPAMVTKCGAKDIKNIVDKNTEC
jgi:hypothetical protein